MSVSRRSIADDLADHAHEVLRGAPPATIIERLEFSIQDLQEISDNAESIAADVEKENAPHKRNA